MTVEGWQATGVKFNLDGSSHDTMLSVTLLRHAPVHEKIGSEHSPKAVAKMVEHCLNDALMVSSVLGAVEDALNHHLTQKDWHTAAAALQVVRSARGTSDLPLDTAVAKLNGAMNGPDLGPETGEDL